MPDPAARFQTTAELVADLDRLDKNGKLLPLVRRLTPRLIAATAALVIAMLGGTYVLTRRAVEPPTQHEPVSMVIADFQNGTNDPTFDGTLEPMLRRALEGAGFISAYDRNGISRTLGVTPARPPGRNGRAGDRREAGAGRGPLRLDRSSRQRLCGFGQDVSVSHGRGNCQCVGPGVRQERGPGGRDEADDHRPPGAR